MPLYCAPCLPLLRVRAALVPITRAHPDTLAFPVYVPLTDAVPMFIAPSRRYTSSSSSGNGPRIPRCPYPPSPNPWLKVQGVRCARGTALL
ncbi:hypothetical protein FB451DRAFT_1272790 [Mycena latifolia]|nr:hypothetical protein FB451DRAFT_1272790 [Mycena latifolia]